MSEMKIDTYKLKDCADRLDRVNSRLVILDNRLNSLYGKVGLLGLFQLIQADVLTGYSGRLSRCAGYLRNTAEEFENVEKKLSDLDPLNVKIPAQLDQLILTNNYNRVIINSVFDASALFMSYLRLSQGLTTDRHHDFFAETMMDGLSSFLSDVGGKNTGSDENERSWFAKLLNNELKTSGAVLSGDNSIEGDFLGFDSAGKVSGSLLWGEAYIKNKGSLKFKNKDGKFDPKSFGASTEAKLTGALAKGSVEGNIGYLHGKLEGAAVTGAISGEARCTLYEDGKFNPSLYLEAKAEGSVLQGKAELGFGDDQYGIYAKANGDLLHAEAKAGAGVGYIGLDDKGNAQYGATAKVSAMACAAKGTVRGGFTLFGIDIDIGLTGYAGAAGVEAGGTITTNGVKAKFGGAMALGGALDISVDWSDAKWIGDTVDAVGKGIGKAVDTVGKGIGKAVDVVGDAIGGVGDFLFGWW